MTLDSLNSTELSPLFPFAILGTAVAIIVTAPIWAPLLFIYVAARLTYERLSK